MTSPGSPIDPAALTPRVLLFAYQNGLFPMGEPDSETYAWYCPDPRAIIPIAGFKIRPSLKRVVCGGRFTITCDRAFELVIRSCAAPRDLDEQTWLNETLISAYVDLHRAGHAHSIEAWRDDQLVGGLYGVHIAGAFFGESMFVRPQLGGTNASKVCFVHLIAWLQLRGINLLDAQMWNPHLEQFGCLEISRDDYLYRLAIALKGDETWGCFDPGAVTAILR